jgi:hypothetical protein
MGGTILGFQDGTVMGGPKPEKMTRGQLSSFSSLGAPLQPPSGAVFRLGSIDPVRDLGSMKDAVGESIGRTIGAGKLDATAKKEMAMIKKMMSEEKKAEKTSLSKSKNLVKDSKKKPKNNKKGGAEKVGSEAELRRILDKEIKKEQKNINAESKRVAQQEASKSVNNEVQKITKGAGKPKMEAGFLRRAVSAVKSVAKKAAPIVKAVAPVVQQAMKPQVGRDGKPKSLLSRLGNAALSHGQQALAQHLAPKPPPPESEPPVEYMDDGFFPQDFEEDFQEDFERPPRGRRGRKGKSKKDKAPKEPKEPKTKAPKDKAEKECPPCKDAYDISTGKDAEPNDKIKSDYKEVNKRENGYFGKGKKGSGMVTSVNAMNGRQLTPVERAQMKSSTLSGLGKPKSERAAIVKKIMNEKGLSMIEASKYVKKNGLY